MSTQETKTIELLVAFPEGQYSSMADWVHYLQTNITIAIRSWQGFNPRCVIDSQLYTYRAIRHDDPSWHKSGYHFGVTIRYHEIPAEPEAAKPTLGSDTLAEAAGLLRALLQEFERKIAAKGTTPP